jgi:drug/metabolite transporter (DMT)-like permease
MKTTMRIRVGIGTILQIEGLRRIKAVQAAAPELDASFFAAIMSFFALGEAVTTLQIVGIPAFL